MPLLRYARSQRVHRDDLGASLWRVAATSLEANPGLWITASIRPIRFTCSATDRVSTALLRSPGYDPRWPGDIAERADGHSFDLVYSTTS